MLGPNTTPRERVTDVESRALDFFQHVVAPVISGPIRTDFWSRIVLQLSAEAPAVRHAAMAVSSLYEGLQPYKPVDKKNPFAIQQYNRSITRLRATPDDEAIVLVVCVLMTCVEMMQGNVDAAIQHCQHGIAILNSTTVSPWTRQRLVPLFCRLSILPFLHGRTPDSFPLLDDIEFLSLARLDDTAPAPTTVEEVQVALDIFIPRCIHFVRTAEPFREKLPDDLPPDLLRKQAFLLEHLGRWKAVLDAFTRDRVLSAADNMTVYIVEIRYLIALIWVTMAFEPDEAAYDQHLTKFQRVVDLSTLVLATSAAVAPASRPKFLFEMGFLPLLYFVVIKCRCLCTRVAALHSMRALAVMRENLWDVDVMYAVAQNVIEMENGVRVDAVDLKRDEPSRHQEKVGLVRAQLERIVEVPPAGGSYAATNKRVTFILKRELQDVVIRERIVMVPVE